MKACSLFFAAALLSMTSYAQLAPDYSNEIGVYGGIAPFTHLTGPRDRGNEQNMPIALSLNYHYNLTESWQAGIDATMMTHLYSTGTETYTGLDGRPLGTAPVSYHYSDRSWAVTARFNWVLPMYDEYHNNRSNFYAGVAGGVFFTINDGGDELHAIQQPARSTKSGHFRIPLSARFRLYAWCAGGL